MNVLRTHFVIFIWVLFGILCIVGCASVSPGGRRDTAESLVSEAFTLEDEPEREKDLYRKAIAADPGNASAYFNLAFVLQQERLFEEAATNYRDCIKYDPQRAGAYFNLANCILITKRESGYLEALKNLHLCIDIACGSENKELLSYLKAAEKTVHQLEKELADLYDCVPRSNFLEEEITTILTRPHFRGPSPYEGPRLPLYLEFRRGSCELNSKAKLLLEEVGKALRKGPFTDGTIQVVGHTDSKECCANTAKEKNLSVMRAKAVQDILVKECLVPRARFLKPKGEGACAPIAVNETVEGRARNRRVEIIRNEDSILRDNRYSCSGQEEGHIAKEQ